MFMLIKDVGKQLDMQKPGLLGSASVHILLVDAADVCMPLHNEVAKP